MSEDTVPISDKTYRNLRNLGWCYPCSNGVCDLTPLGTVELMKSIKEALSRNRDDEPIREEWLAPN